MAQWIEFAVETDGDYNEILPQAGDVVYIRRYQDLNAKREFGGRTLICALTPWTTNMKGIALLQGWLGTTNNVYAEADGAAIVSEYWPGIPGNESQPAQVKVRRIKDTDERIPAELRG